ncbi:hypothetical protein RIF29_22250 [Crotalaria pallida]|uniref:RNase H type-1 domain-containing protein n=1 Tax=Crotalaria pallida TaxID=3830 RepID=A0AAN9F4N1_CROPI
MYGGSQFFKALIELARGNNEPSVKPVWERERLAASATKLPFQDLMHGASVAVSPFGPSTTLMHECFKVDHESIRKLKMRLMKENGNESMEEKSFTAFEALAACVWRSRARALQLKNEGKTILSFVVGMRGYLDLPLPDGYYGNAILDTVAVLRNRHYPSLQYIENFGTAFMSFIDWRHLGLMENIDLGGCKLVNMIPIPCEESIFECIIADPRKHVSSTVEEQQVTTVTVKKKNSGSLSVHSPHYAAAMNIGLSMIKDFEDANQQTRSINGPPNEPTIRTPCWPRPPIDWVCLNTDAAVFRNGSIGLGAVARNHEGSIIFTASKLLKDVVDPLLAEALAMRWGLDLALKQGCSNIAIQSDSLLLCSAIHGLYSSVLIRVILEDINSMLDCLNNYTVRHVPRTLNMPAHKLASSANIYTNALWWQSGLPNVIQAVLADISS